MKFSLKTLLWGILMLAVFLFAGLSLVPTAVEVEFATAASGPLRVSVQEDGKTRIRERYVVSAPVSGRLSRIELDAGDQCDEETLLAVILPSAPAILDLRARAEANARVRAAEAALERTKSGAEQSRINFELNSARYQRAQNLLPSRAISQSEYDIAQAERLASAQAIKTAQFDIEIATFELEMARAAVDQFAESKENSVDPFEIYAPISGRVLRILQESSTVVTMGTPLIEVGDPRNLEIEIDVLSTDAVRIKSGAELTIEHWGGEQPLRGYVRVIEPGAFTKVSSLGVEEQRVNIIADFNEPAARTESLGDGYRVEARITVDEADDAILIPNSALFRHQRRWHVLAVAGDKAALQPVTIGLQNEFQTQITAGLSSGDRVIVYPSDAIKAGTSVRLISRP